MPEAEDRSDLISPWFIFNDFVVTNVSEEEALSFPGIWKVCSNLLIMTWLFIPLKVPAIIYLERVDLRGKLDFSDLPARIDPSILSQDISLSS